MDPNIKLLLDEIKSVQTSLTNIDSKLLSRIDAIEHAIGGSFDKLESAAKVFDTWKPQVDASMEEVRAEISMFRKTDESVQQMHSNMTALRKTINRAALASAAAPTGVLSPPLVFAKTAPGGSTSSGPFGHGVETSHRLTGDLSSKLFPRSRVRNFLPITNQSLRHIALI